MGWFDWLFRSTGPKVRTSDRIWMTKAAKFRDMASSVATEHRTRRHAIVLLAHFPDTLEILQVIAARFNTGRPVMATLARDFLAHMQSANLHVHETVLILVGERHPHPAFDEAVLTSVAMLPQQCSVDYYLALDDALMRAFAGDWIVDTLRTLGMKEDESIESAMVTRRIFAAQKKIAVTSVTDDDDSPSADVWIERHCPQFLKK